MLTKDDLSTVGGENEYTKQDLDKYKREEKLQLVTSSSSKDTETFSVHKAF